MFRRNGRNGGGDEVSQVFRSFSDKIAEYPLLTRKQEVELFKRIEAGDEQARENVMYSNLRLVIRTASIYWRISKGRSRQAHFSLEDLIQEGLIGLGKAVEKFEWRRGNKFSTCATWWIRQAVTRAVYNTGNTIRLPVPMQARISKYHKTVVSLTKELGRAPKIGEVAERMKLKVSSVRDLRVIIQTQHLSLDEPFSSESPDNTLLSVTPSKDIQPWRDAHGRNILMIKREKVEKILGSLTSQERDVLTWHFGLDGQGVRTLEEIGGVYGLTRERIRQIERRALLKLREHHEEELIDLLFGLNDVQ